MKRLNRDEEAVSPVIATILMVAITVVLAATLYMMVGDIGGEGDTDLVVSVSGEVEENGNGESWFNVTMDRMSTPSSAEQDDVEFTLIEDGNEYSFTADEGSWILTDDDELQTGSEGTFTHSDVDFENDELGSFIDADRIVLSIDGYAGTEEVSGI